MTIFRHRSLSHLLGPFTKVPRREAVCGKAANWRAGGRQQIQGGVNVTGNVLHLDCDVVLWAAGLWVVFIQTANFIVCRFYLSQANNRQKTQLLPARPLGPTLPPLSPYQM